LLLVCKPVAPPKDVATLLAVEEAVAVEDDVAVVDVVAVEDAVAVRESIGGVWPVVVGHAVTLRVAPGGLKEGVTVTEPHMDTVGDWETVVE
jgi:hypothetical protein